MTYVQRLPQLQIPSVEISGRTLALFLVVGLHVLLIGLILEQLRTTRRPVVTDPTPVALLPNEEETRLPRDLLETAAPTWELARVEPRMPILEIEPAERSAPVPVDIHPGDGAGSGSAQTEPPVRVQPRQDPANPLGRPMYPPASIRLAEAGVVVVNVCIDREGRASSVRVAASSGYRRLDQAALAHLRRPSVRLLPGLEDGVPVAMCADLRFRFGFEPD